MRTFFIGTFVYHHDEAAVFVYQQFLFNIDFVMYSGPSRIQEYHFIRHHLYLCTYCYLAIAEQSNFHYISVQNTTYTVCFKTCWYRLLYSLVVECWLRVREVPGSIPSQGPRHTKDVIKMVPVVPLFSTEHSKGELLALSQELRQENKCNG